MSGMGKVADPPHTKLILAEFGRRLRKWRDGGGMSRADLAQKLDMDDHHRIQKYEEGKSAMPYYYLLKLVEVSSYPLDYWLRQPDKGKIGKHQKHV